MVRASVIIPTWDAPITLESSVRSALRQTESDLEVVIVGDGVADATRAAVAAVRADDDRVRFLDQPKAPGRGEANRDFGVRAAASDVIVYLADDDLLMPRHVELVLEAMGEANFVQSRNGYINVDDRVEVLPTDLSDARWLDWHLADPPRNAVSLTGTAHTRSLYLELEDGWEIPPAGSWADLTLWRKFFRHEKFRGATRGEMTTLQFPADLHRDRSPQDFAESFARWDRFTREPGAHERLQELADEAAKRMLIELNAIAVYLNFEVASRDARISDLVREVTAFERDVAELKRAIAERDREITDLRGASASGGPV